MKKREWYAPMCKLQKLLWGRMIVYLSQQTAGGQGDRMRIEAKRSGEKVNTQRRAGGRDLKREEREVIVTSFLDK